VVKLAAISARAVILFRASDGGSGFPRHRLRRLAAGRAQRQAVKFVFQPKATPVLQS
jgi:hypothetical protein